MNEKLNHLYGKEETLGLKDFLKLIYSYKILIMFITLLALFLTSAYLFFKPSIYSTYAIIELKTQNAKNRQIANDDFLQTALTVHNEEIEKEIEILKTFNVNKKVLDIINLKTQFFVDEEYKKSEVFTNIPIEIAHINIFDGEIIGKMFAITLEKDGFYIDFEHSLRDRVLDLVSDKKLKVFKSHQKYPYNQRVKTEFFELMVQKRNDFNHKIYFVMNGTSQDIYENIVKNTLQVEQINKNASLVKITYEDTIPQRAQQYVDTLVKVFVERGKLNKNKQNNQILEFMKKRRGETKIKLDQAEKELETYTLKNKIIEPSVEVSALRQELSSVEIQLSENILKENLVNDLWYSVQNHQLDVIAPTLVEFNDNATLNLINELQRTQLEAQALEPKYTENYPELMILRNKINSLEEKIVLNIKNLKATTINKVKTLQRLKAKYEQQLLSLPQKEKKLIDLERDYDVNAKMYDYFLNKIEERAAIKAATVSDYDIIERPSEPKNPIKPRRPLILLVSMIVGLLLGFLLALLHNNLRSVIKRQEDIYKNTKLDLYTMIPLIKKSKYKVEVLEHPQSSFSESFRKLRTDLQFATTGNQSNIIVVTSTVAKEGKSTVVANLGAILNSGGFNVVMIDLDLRQPDLHKYYDLNYEKGISRYLRGEANYPEIIFPTEHVGLEMIPVGSVPANPSELILSTRLPKLLDKLKETYDYIIIDTTSVDVVTDTINIMRYADINLFIFRKDYAEKSFIKKLEKIIEKYGLKNIGLIFNGSNQYKNYDAIYTGKE